MAITFDPAAKRIILDSASVTAEEIFSRWEDWAVTADNAKYGMVIRHTGGEELGNGRFTANYFFLQGDWRVRPMELDHTLALSGNIATEGGGVPVVSTTGVHNVVVQYTVPVQAQAITASGATIDYSAVAAAVLAALNATTIPVNTTQVNGHTIYGTGLPPTITGGVITDAGDVFRTTP